MGSISAPTKLATAIPVLRKLSTPATTAPMLPLARASPTSPMNSPVALTFFSNQDSSPFATL